MPKSRSRKKSDYVAPVKKQRGVSALGGRWVVPTMLTLLIIGLAWVVLYYVASGSIGFKPRARNASSTLVEAMPRLVHGPQLTATTRVCGQRRASPRASAATASFVAA